MTTCGQCADGWISEQHPDQPWPHGNCAGPGVPCENPMCEFSILKTGLVCPQCRRSSGSITTEKSRVMGFACRECGYRWWSDGRKGA